MYEYDLPAELSELAHLIGILGQAETAAALLRAAHATNDALLLYRAGYALIDLGLGHFAVAPLHEALVLQPRELTILNELVVALAECERHDEAGEVMRSVRGAIQEDETTRAQYAHSLAMTGNLTALRWLYPSLGDSSEVTALLRRIAGNRLSRHSALEPFGRPDEGDLRGWELVLNGMLVLDVASAEYVGMSGRWGAVWDQPDAFAARLTLLHHAISSSVQALTCVQHTRDRDSEILAWALATRLGLRTVPLSAGLQDDSVVVTYSWSQADELRTIQFPQPGRVIVFAYALDWTTTGLTCPDIVGLEAQAVYPTWDNRMRVVGQPGSPKSRMETLPPDDRPAAEIGRELAAIPGQPDAAQVADVNALIQALREAGTPCGLLTGERQQFYPGGPVVSNRFA